MKILVTGGTGMISAGVVKFLVARGDDVTVFHRGGASTSHQIPELLGDRCDYPRFVEMVRSHGPWDCIIDMIGGSKLDAESLVAAGRGLTQQVILCSTTTVYGRPFARIPVVEDGAILAPPSPYGDGKLACEERLMEAASCGDFAVTIVRPAHTYNERSLVIHSLGNRSSHLDRILNGRPIIVHDGGQGLWSSVWADDVGFAIANAAGEGKAFNRTYHLAGAEWFTWDAYHHTLAVALGVPKPEIVHIPTETLARLAPNRARQIMNTLRFPGVYDCSAAKADLAFQPQVTLAEGLARNVKYLRENGLIEPWEQDGEYEATVAAWLKSNEEA